MRKADIVGVRLIKYGICLTMLSILLSGCGNIGDDIKDMLIEHKVVDEEAEAAKETTGFKSFAIGEYDSYDTAVVVKVTAQKNELTLLNTKVNRKYTLSFDGTTTVFDQNGQALSMAQLGTGDIVNVKFRHLPKKCVSIEKNPGAWEYTNVSDYTYQFARNQMLVQGDLFSLADRMVLMSGKEEMDVEDLNENDIVRICGLDKTVYAITVERGHGYLRLKGTDYFQGGWIEIGNKYVQRISKDMLLTVPEGDYKVVVRNGKIGGSMQVTVHSGEETLLDLTELKGEEIKTGNIFFTLYPLDAKIYIDGDLVDTSTFVTLEYGLHQMIVKAAGYETISQYLRVGQENANLNIEMEPESKGNIGGDPEQTDKTEEEAMAAYDALPTEEALNGTAAEKTQIAQTGVAAEGAASQNTSATPSVTTPATPKQDTTELSAGDGSRNVKINAPEGAEVYVDGNYVGLVPTSFPKEAGTHVVSLRKTGFQTRSYTIQIDRSDKDVDLSFSELVEK